LLVKQHHIAIIVLDYEKSKWFYVDVLGCTVRAEHFRSERNSWKCDLDINGVYTLELFTFPGAPKRVSQPEALGLRHVAFTVENLDDFIAHLANFQVICEPVRIDEFTGARFTFFSDPDGLPIELVEPAV
jgi:glyoxylase I family protein